MLLKLIGNIPNRLRRSVTYILPKIQKRPMAFKSTNTSVEMTAEPTENLTAHSNRKLSNTSNLSNSSNKKNTTTNQKMFDPKKHYPISLKHEITKGSMSVDPEGVTYKKLDLIIAGQGVIELETDKLGGNGWLVFEFRENNNAFILKVLKDTLIFSVRTDGNPEEVLFRKKLEGIGIETEDLSPQELVKLYTYWFSLDSYNGILRYGKGELRKETTLALYDFSQQKDIYYPWAKNIKQASIKAISREVIQKCEIWRDPIVIDTAVKVAKVDDITMQMAASYVALAPSALTEECQLLYGNVSGKKFTLNTPDFQNFIDAIEYSIKNPQGWCYKKLKEKASEFGEKDEKATYLRITLGSEQGNSPGVPYVMEIWPGGHYSPIHNHGGANAIIKVLHGEISVELFSFLSINNKIPFSKKIFAKDDVTWITPQLNQTHRLSNPNEAGPSCITIQCYLYNLKDKLHYEYFDYIDSSGKKIGNFNPVSDMDFIVFRETMRAEWQRKQQADSRVEGNKQESGTIKNKNNTTSNSDNSLLFMNSTSPDRNYPRTSLMPKDSFQQTKHRQNQNKSKR